MYIIISLMTHYSDKQCHKQGEVSVFIRRRAKRCPRGARAARIVIISSKSTHFRFACYLLMIFVRCTCRI